jgi:hypothetical protein
MLLVPEAGRAAYRATQPWLAALVLLDIAYRCDALRAAAVFRELAQMHTLVLDSASLCPACRIRRLAAECDDLGVANEIQSRCLNQWLY